MALRIRRTDRSKGRRTWRFIRRLAVLTVALAAGAGLWMLYLVRSEPAAWVQHREFIESTPTGRMAQIAAEAEARLMRIAGLLAGPAQAKAGSAEPGMTGALEAALAGLTDEELARPRTVRLSRPEINALLQVRLEDWLTERGYQMPSEIRDPMIAIQGSGLVLGFRLESGGFSQVFTAPAEIVFADNGKANISVSRFSAGRLLMPTEALSGFVAAQAPEASRLAEAAAWLQKLKHIEVKPVLKLQTRHRIHVTDFRIADDGVELTFVLEKPTQYGPAAPGPEKAPAAEDETKHLN